jgi:hypothetical protein
MRIGVRRVGHNQIYDECLFAGAIDQDRVSPVHSVGGDDHEYTHQSKQDSPLLKDDGVILDEIDFLDMLHCPPRPKGIQSAQCCRRTGDNKERPEREMKKRFISQSRHSARPRASKVFNLDRARRDEHAQSGFAKRVSRHRRPYPILRMHNRKHSPLVLLLIRRRPMLSIRNAEGYCRN